MKAGVAPTTYLSRYCSGQRRYVLSCETLTISPSPNMESAIGSARRAGLSGHLACVAVRYGLGLEFTDQLACRGTIEKLQGHAIPLLDPGSELGLHPAELAAQRPD